MSEAKERSKPTVVPEYCKGCARCIEACPQNCISLGTQINPQTGLMPIVLNLDACTGCGLCTNACPEPYGLMMEEDFHLMNPKDVLGERQTTATAAKDIADEWLPLPETRAMIIKGTYASAIGAILAGCRHVYGYPITPSTEGAEFMAKVLPHMDGVFFQALSETATVNMMYGTGGAGLRTMTFTSSPGFSLMLEGVSYMIGAEVPSVFVNVMRGGPGLGNIAPEQSDIKLCCRGLGHGNTHAVVYAPATPQEMLDYTMKAFDVAFKYRNPVVIVADGYLGQITGKVNLPRKYMKPGLPAWSVYGDKEHRKNLISSICLSEKELDLHNRKLNKKYDEMKKNEQIADLFRCEDAEYIMVATNTPSKMATGAVQMLREKGIKIGLFRPITLWPFPIDALKKLLPNTKAIIMVEASPGQLEDELRLALSHSGVQQIPKIAHLRTYGGLLPQVNEICETVMSVVGGKL